MFTMTAKAKKAPNETDVHVGARVRMRRMQRLMSQEKLGDALGLTFQQIQKYEKGANRIGASRMQQIATVLQCPVSFFFEGLPSVDANGASLAPLLDGSIEAMRDFTTSGPGLQIVAAWPRITPGQRAAFAKLVASVAEGSQS